MDRWSMPRGPAGGLLERKVDFDSVIELFTSRKTREVLIF